MTQTDPATRAGRNHFIDGELADIRRLVSVLNLVANEVIPEEADDIREPIFAVIDAIADKVEKVEGMLGKEAP